MSNTSNNIPRSLAECTQPDSVSIKLWAWAAWLEKAGFWLLIIFAVCGIISTGYAFVSTMDINEDMALSAAVSSLLSWLLYIVIEYCVYNALALLISALASITQNISASTKVALFRAANETIAAQASQTLTKETSPAIQEQKPAAAVSGVAETAGSPAAGQERPTDQPARKASSAVPAKTADLKEHFQYALRYSTDDGMVRYLQTIGDATILEILKQPKHTIRQRLKEIIEQQ